MIRSLIGIRTEEATFTFKVVDWEAPFQESLHSSKWSRAIWTVFSRSVEEDQMARSSAWSECLVP